MVGHTLTALALTISTALSVAIAPRQNSSGWQGWSLTASQRAANLLPQLSWEEKIAQMGGIRQLLGTNATFNRTTWDTLYPLQHGILSKLFSHLLKLRLTPAGYGNQLNSAEDVLRVANMVREEQLNSSSKIPWISVTDSVNSIYVTGGTIFPATLSLSSSWNLPLYEQVVAAIRDENMALGTKWVLSPELDVAKDPRNGRVGEM